MFRRSFTYLFVVMFILTSFTYPSQPGKAQEAASQALSTADPAARPFFIGIDYNRNIYAMSINSGISQKIHVGYGDIAAVSDFDNDGQCDVLTVSNLDRNLTFYEGSYNTGFTSKIVSEDAYPATGFFFNRTLGDSAVGDFDGNGLPDLAITGRRCSQTACEPGGEGLVQVLLNQGGSFQRYPVNITDITGLDYESMTGIDNADLNEDGLDDLLAQQYGQGGTYDVHYLRSLGNGTFVDTIPFSAGSRYASSLISGDFNNDTYPDVINGQDDDNDSGQAWLYLGEPISPIAYTFSYFGEAYDPNPIDEVGALDKPGAGYSDAYDFDGDGNLDAIVAARGIGLLLYYGNGDGTFDEGIMLDDTSVSGNDWVKVAAPPDNAPACVWGMGLSDIDLTGPAEGATHTNITFNVTTGPITATLPLTYTWSATGLPTLVHGSLMSHSDSAGFKWDIAGTQVVTVTVTDIYGGQITDARSIQIKRTNWTIFLPNIQYSNP